MTLCGVAVSAQKVHFVYFETDNAQPFYLKWDDKVYSSNAAGSFLLPNLPDSSYTLSIGFPSTSTESKFRLAVNGRDYGYAIKTFEFGIGLFDMQSLAVTKPQVDNWKSTVSYEYRSSDFTSLLAKASNDTSLFYIPVVMKEEVVVQKPEANDDAKPVTKIEAISDTGFTRLDSVAVGKSEGAGATGVAVIPFVKPAEKIRSTIRFPGGFGH